MDDILDDGHCPCLESDYEDALRKLDVAVCEAQAVSQAINVEEAELHIGFSVQIFRKLCSHSVALICSVPRSRWVVSDFENWDFVCIAAQGRAILEGYLLFLYLTKTPSCDAEWSARLLVLYINDCTRRAQIMSQVKATDAAEDLRTQTEELRDRIRRNPWFLSLDDKTRKRCLAGQHLMISSRDEVLEDAGWDSDEFNAVWNLLSQYSHVLPMSFTRMEVGGRGSGSLNQTDLDYMTATISMCADTLHAATNYMASAFAYTEVLRRGINSVFESGPKANRSLQ
ncbi:hypothetical protein [Pseudomonas sichuanensis]|uniref:hypothetical protein n=1 Tax=Pseudomonas TaxID=286 RepID=UPI0036E1BCF6